MTDGFRKADEVKFEGEEFERARSYETKLQELGQDLVGSLHMLVRNVKLYGPENQIFVKPLEKLRDTVNTIIAVDKRLDLQCAGTSFYLNDMLLRIETKYIESIKYLHGEFERCDVGGFALDKSVNLRELRNFIYIFGKENEELASERGVGDRPLQMLKLRSFQVAQQILEHEEQEALLKDARLDRKRFAMVVYARTIHFMRSFYAGLRGEGQKIPMAMARPILQDLVDVCFGHRTHFLGVTAARVEAGNLAYHSVNTTVLAIVFGIELGLSKKRLRDLATAALFREIGKAELDPALLAKRGEWTPEERAQMARVPRLTVKNLMRLGKLDLVNMHSMVVAYDHLVEYGKPIKDIDGKTVMVEPVGKLSLFARIVAIADCYETLTHLWKYTPEDALQLMSSEWLQRFDPVLVRVFTKIVSDLASEVLEAENRELVLFTPPQGSAS